MGARLIVRFEDSYYGKDEQAPRVYLHWGGEYEEQIKETLDAFIAEIDANLTDKRLDDPTYLAAKLIVWAASQQTGPEAYGGPKNALDFLSVGVATDDGMGDAVAVFDCSAGDGSYRIERALDVHPVEAT